MREGTLSRIEWRPPVILIRKSESAVGAEIPFVLLYRRGGGSGSALALEIPAASASVSAQVNAPGGLVPAGQQ